MTLKAYTSRAGAVRGRTRPLLLRILSADSTSDLFVPVDGLRSTIYAVDPDTGMADGKISFEELTTRGTAPPAPAAPAATTYRIASMPTFEAGGATHGGEVIRDNDGALIIMECGPGPDDNRRAVVVPRVADVKRSERHNAEDPAQDAFARRLVDLLNGPGAAT